MRTVNLKQARQRLSDLVDAAERGASIIITRRGRKAARIGPIETEPRRPLPDLSAFRASLKVKGKPLSETVTSARRKQRY